MATILVSYNMSFASDKGLDPKNKADSPASEMSFLKQQYQEGTETRIIDDKRQYWVNAKNLLFSFVRDQQKLDAKLVLGLQEMNKTSDGLTGSSFIDTNMPSKTNYNFLTDFVYVQESQQPALTTVWDKTFGNLTQSRIYEMAQNIPDNESYDSKNTDTLVNYEPLILPNGTVIQGVYNIRNKLIPSLGQSGRPILFVYTDKGYLFINIQATNNPADSANGYVDELALIRSKFILFTTFAGIDMSVLDKNKIFVMGDFNDRYGGLLVRDADNKPVSGALDLTDSIKLVFEGSQLSCCHNLDSSCTQEEYNASTSIKNPIKPWTKDCPTRGYQTVGPREYDKIYRMGEAGNVENYRYYGDYCFASQGGELMKYPSSRTGPSTESDHEMVYMIVSGGSSTRTSRIIDKDTGLPVNSGGRRRRRTIKRRKCSKRRRPTRRGRGRRSHRRR